MSELPDELRAALPEEDIRRLTPETARDLVNSLLTSLPGRDAKPKKKKTVKVKRVKKVRKKKKVSARDNLIARIPEEVRDSVPEGALESLTIEELEALVSSSGELEETAEEKPTKKKKKLKTTEKLSAKRKQLLESIPPVIRESLSDKDLQSMSDDDLQSFIETDDVSDEDDSGEPTLESLTRKYGQEKAEILPWSNKFNQIHGLLWQIRLRVYHTILKGHAYYRRVYRFHFPTVIMQAVILHQSQFVHLNRYSRIQSDFYQ
jgi:hypothetical protein